MCQRRNNIAWRLAALFSVLSIGISLFAMSPIPTYAIQPSPYTLQIYVIRPASSTVGSVRYKDVDNSELASGCFSLPNQNSQTLFQTYPNQDHILIEHFPDGNCSAPGFPNPANNVFTRIYKLGTPYMRNCCRLYTLPPQA